MAAERRSTTLLYSTGEREDDFWEQLRWVLPIAFLGSAMVLIAAVVRWWDPLWPTLVYLAGLWVPLMGVVAWRCGLSNPRGLALAGVCLGLFAVPLMAWNSGFYRGAVLWSYERLMPAELPTGASSDRSDWVATLACESTMGDRIDGVVSQMRGELSDRPEVAASCLRSVAAEEEGTAIQVARFLQETWYRGWLGGDGGDERPGQCREVAHFREVSEVTGHGGTPELLHCSVSAVEEDVARCCAEVLNEHVPDEEIRQVEPEQWLRDMEQDLFRALANDLSGGARQMADTLRWSDETLYYWANELGCYLMRDEDMSREALSRQLARMTDAQCGREIGESTYSFATMQMMGQTCVSWGDLSTEEKTTSHWCEAASDAGRQAAVDTASFLVYEATQRQGYRELRGGMARGWQRHQAMASRQSIFGVGSGGRYDEREAAGTAGVRLQRPQWTHGWVRQGAAEREKDERYFERRDEAREEVEREQSEARRSGEEGRSEDEVDREAARRAGRQSRDAIEELRQQSE